MATRTNVRKSMTPLSQAEIEPILRDVAQALSRPRTTEERQEMVMALLARRMRRGQIVQIVCKAFDVKPRAVDEDIALAKDKFIEWASKTSSEQHLADSVATMDEVIQRGFRKDDLSAVVQAQKHRDILFGLADNEEGARHQLGVIILPEQLARDAWKKKFSKP